LQGNFVFGGAWVVHISNLVVKGDKIDHIARAEKRRGRKRGREGTREKKMGGLILRKKNK